MRNVIVKTSLLLMVSFVILASDYDPLADMELESFEPKPLWLLNGFYELRQQQLAHSFNALSSRHRLQGELEFQPEESDIGLFFARISLRLEQEKLQGMAVESNRRIHEAYIQYGWQHWTWALGRKRVAIGMADGRSTFDLINPIDRSDPLATGRNSTRLSSDLVSAQWSEGQHGLSIWLIPKAEVNRLAARSSPWASEDGVIEAADISVPKEPEVLVRYSFFGQGTDVSLLYFNGFNDDPIFSTDMQTGDIQYMRYQAYGFQWAKGMGNSTLRGELSWKRGISILEGVEPSKTNLQQLIIGWDRNLDEGRYLNFQLFYDKYLGVSQFNQYGITYAVKDVYWQEALEVGFRGTWEWKNNQMISELYLQYQHNDHWQWKAGRYWINGDSGTDHDWFHKNELFYFQATYLF